MKFLDLFAGVGGIRLGMEQAGHECVGWVEWDKFARKSYQAIHDTTNEWTATDINEVNATDIPRANVWCFGFPCQDISLAGKQGGFTNGKRSSLFFTVTGLIKQLKEEDRPEILFIENVKNLLSINGGWDFLKLQIELDEIGYDTEWDALNSAEVVPQHRERVYIIGHLRGRSTREVFPIRREDGKTTSSNEIKVIGNTSDTGYRSHDVLGTDGISTTLMSRDYKGPKQIAVKQVGNISDSDSFGGNSQTGRVYGTDGLALTLSTMQGGGQEPKIAIREATKKGYAEAAAGDSVNISQPNSKTRRGRVGKQIANTLETSLNQGVVIGASRGRNPDNPSDRRTGSPTEQRLEINQDGVSNTLTTVQKDNYVVQEISSNFYCKDDVVLTEKQFKNNESFFEPSYIYTEPTVLRIGNHKLLLINQDLTQAELILVGENYCLSEWVSCDEEYINLLLSLEPKEKFGRMGTQAVETFNENECEFGDTINPFNKTIDKSGFSPTLTTRPEGFKTAILPVTNNLRIRKLTPKECWRLQGFPDWAFDKAQEAGLSNSQLYKQAGNSVTVPVIKAIAERLSEEEEK